VLPAGVVEGPAAQRLTDLETAVTRLTEQYETIYAENERLGQQLREQPTSVQGGASADVGERRSLSDQPDDIRTDQPEAAEEEAPTDSFFDEGFKWSTKDGEYDLVLHNETQLDLRAYTQAHSDPVNQFGFYISRMRMYFNGHLSKPIEYSVSINKGLGDLDLLDAYFNFNYDERLQVRIGRFRVPFTYDWYALSNQFLPTPERSVFAVNYGYNRNWAVMLHGELGENRAEWAAALALGPRNQYFDFNADKDALGYINWRPFQDAGFWKPLEYLNVGGSMTYGLQGQSPRPAAFRTSLNATESEGAIEAAPSFLVLGPDVFEQGPRWLKELHLAYYYKQLSLITAWDTGFNSYSVGDQPSVRVPTHGYHIQASYFLTGEEVTRRTFVDPLSPFDLRKGKQGTGAIELQARYDDFVVGDEIFSSGFADSASSTDRVQTIDAGVNWYLNKYTKIYFDFQHSQFATPIPYRPGAFQSASNLFWTRFQVYW